MHARHFSRVVLPRTLPWLVAIAVLLGNTITAHAQSTGLKSDPAPLVAKNVHMDLVYGTADKLPLKLDIFVPKNAKPTNPAVMLIHGVSFVSGGRVGLRPFAQDLAASGYVAIVVGYRHDSKYAFPAPMEDIDAALGWVQANATKFHIDKNRIGAVGFSAGGGLAMMLAAKQPRRVRAVVSYYAPSDVAHLYQNASGWKGLFVRGMLEQNLGGAPGKVFDRYRAASPIHQVNANSPPTLMIHGTDDDIVPCEHSKAMNKKLRSLGAKAELLTLEGAKHFLDEKKDFYATVAFLSTELFLATHLRDQRVVAQAGRGAPMQQNRKNEGVNP